MRESGHSDWIHGNPEAVVYQGHPTPTLGRAWTAGHTGPSDPGLRPQASLVLDPYCVILKTASFQRPGPPSFVPGHNSVILNHQHCVCARRLTLKDTHRHTHTGHCTCLSEAFSSQAELPALKAHLEGPAFSPERPGPAPPRDPPPPQPFLSPAPHEWTPRRPPEGAGVLHSHHLPADRHTSSSWGSQDRTRLLSFLAPRLQLHRRGPSIHHQTPQSPMEPFTEFSDSPPHILHCWSLRPSPYQG